MFYLSFGPCRVKGDWDDTMYEIYCQLKCHTGDLEPGLLLYPLI